MKLTKLFFALFALTISTTTFAFSGPEFPSVREEIQSLIQNSDLVFDQSEKVLINFLINNESKLIVLSTSGNIDEESIRSILNLKKVNKGELETNTVYTLPVQLKVL